MNVLKHDFEILKFWICGGFLEKIANSLVCKMWKKKLRNLEVVDI
jgi:hypothetical protein